MSVRIAQKDKQDEDIIGLIPIDSIFTPVKKVNFIVEDTRVGHVTDFDRLTLEVWTNGTLTPEEAVGLSAQILIEYLKLFTEINESYTEVEIMVEKEEEEKNKVLEMLIEELELSVRASNGLKRANINTVGDLVEKLVRK